MNKIKDQGKSDPLRELTQKQQELVMRFRCAENEDERKAVMNELAKLCLGLDMLTETMKLTFEGLHVIGRLNARRRALGRLSARRKGTRRLGARRRVT